jgi:uncharacterized protein
MLIPAGMRYQEDANTGKEVDLIEAGKEKGITVKEVSNIFEAYKELTGKDLPKATGASKDKVELPAAVFKKLKLITQEWYDKYTDERAAYSAYKVSVATDTEDAWIASADAMAAKADSYLKQGMVSSAYEKITNAYMYTAMAYSTKRAVNAYVTQGGVAGAENYMSTINPSGKKMDDAFDALKNKKAETLADTMVIADAFGRLSMADGLIKQAKATMDAEATTVEQATTNVITATLYYVIASYAIDWSKDSVEIGFGNGTAKPADKAQVLRLSEALRKAAEANLDYFDNVVLKGWAEQAGVDMNTARGNFMANDFNYGFAVSSIVGAQELKDKLGNTEARANAVLGNSLLSFTLSSQLIAKYYSLQAETDDNLNIVSIPFEKSLINMMDFADQTALENINSAKKAGALPVMAIIAYDGAKVTREGTPDDKLDALGSFWNAGMQGRMLTILAGMKVSRAGESGSTGFAKVLGE